MLPKRERPLTRAEFKTAFEQAVQLIKLATANLNERITKRLAELKDGAQGPQGTPGAQGPAGKDGRDGRDGLDGHNGVDGAPGTPGKDGSPDTADDIRNKLELLAGDERLDAKYIKGLDEHTARALKSLDYGPGAGTSFAILQSGTQKVQQPLALDFKGAGAPTVSVGQNGVTHLDFPAGNPTVYTETLTDTGDHQNFTAAHTITTVYVLATLNGQYISSVNYTKSGDTITLTSADAGIAGVGLELVYAS